MSPSGDLSVNHAPNAEGRVRDTSRPILLIGFLERGNLGLGYLAAVLRQHGYQVLIRDFETAPPDLLRTAQAADPLIIGFSVIFQFYVGRFQTVAHFLRENGVACHFTAGGHFPSLSYEHTLSLIPELDSVVRFEGEFTLLELADLLSMDADWHGIRGIAYRSEDSVEANPPRPLLADLDTLPYPVRDFEPWCILGRRAMPVMASRGCARSCSFCSIHMFYGSAPGQIVRTRKPASVAEEMRALCDKQNIRIFLFQDDNFPLFGPRWRRWAYDFACDLSRQRIPGRAIWRVSCRVDAVEPELFATLRDAGLYLTYLGLESGTDEGLATLNKGNTVEQSLRGIAVLKRLGLSFEFGFMMFEPSSTFDSIRANIAFLRRIVGDGSASAAFCRMLPYDGTPIKAALQEAGRLHGDVCDPEYDFLDPRLDGLFAELSRLISLSGWISGPRALSAQLSFAWNELAVMERLFPPLVGLEQYRRDLRGITRDSNETLFRSLEELADTYEDGRVRAKPRRRGGRTDTKKEERSSVQSNGIRARSRPLSVEDELVSSRRSYVARFMDTRTKFIGRNQDVLMDSLNSDACRMT